MAAVAELRFGMALRAGSTTTVAAVDPATTVEAGADLQVGSGSDAAPDDRSVLVSTAVADANANGWTVGDTVELTCVQNGRRGPLRRLGRADGALRAPW
jgi:hypothetical protein